MILTIIHPHTGEIKKKIEPVQYVVDVDYATEQNSIFQFNRETGVNVGDLVYVEEGLFVENMFVVSTENNTKVIMAQPIYPYAPRFIKPNPLADSNSDFVYGIILELSKIGPVANNSIGQNGTKIIPMEPIYDGLSLTELATTLFKQYNSGLVAAPISVVGNIATLRYYRFLDPDPRPSGSVLRRHTSTIDLHITSGAPDGIYDDVNYYVGTPALGWVEYRYVWWNNQVVEYMLASTSGYVEGIATKNMVIALDDLSELGDPEIAATKLLTRQDTSPNATITFPREILSTLFELRMGYKYLLGVTTVFVGELSRIRFETSGFVELTFGNYRRYSTWTTKN